ncbi:Hypothetical protein, putative [Bodo saltans]|uniref:Uncharacterized protein n=1 Tax=Bodo saltans TaxID=75058 RepID=A0A0S4IU03_BODSA|nr:Hypothetical protein, putative [Bodo saltans]|eukprot:CUF83623.1 Hypothetical protein, putative [Bodo saltans]
MSVLQNPPFDPNDAVHLVAFSTALRGTTNARVMEDLALSMSSEPSCGASQKPLFEVYGEVGLLRALLIARISVRDFAAAANSFTASGVHLANHHSSLEPRWRKVAAALTAVAELLPDAVLVHLAAIVHSVADAGPTHNQKSLDTVRLLSEITEILVRVQQEILQNSKSLKERCQHITIHFNDVFPFCVTH